MSEAPNTPPKTIPELIDRFGGSTAFARAINLKNPSTASEMKRSGRIRADYWPAIAEAAANRPEPIDGVTIESIALMQVATIEKSKSMA